MKWNSEHVDLLVKRKDAIDLLPNVKPRKAKRLLDNIREYFLEMYCHDDEPYEPYDIKGMLITESDYQMMMVIADDYWGEVDYITPEGAAILIRMYRKGCFELKKRNDCLGDTQELEEYAASGERLFSQHAVLKEHDKQQRAQELYWKEHPEELPEDKFTASRLNAIMWHHNVIGTHSSMDIGGITVTKEVSQYKSNSGKSHDNEVVLKWIGSDGIPREEYLRTSSYRNNRRNDADRNWGLHE